MSTRIECLLGEVATSELCQDVVHHMEVGLHLYHLEDPADDRTLRFIGANAAAERITGAPASAFLGNLIDDNFPGTREMGLPQAYAEVVRTGRSWRSEQFVYGSDRVVSAAFAVKAVALPGHCLGVLFEDATIRLRAQEDLRVSEARQRALVRALPDTLYRVLRDGSLRDVKEGAPAPLALALRVAAALVEPLGLGEVRVFESEDRGEDIEVRLVNSGEEELLAIVRDISERKRGERRKDEFISVVSHELRTPLTSIRGALGLMEGGVVGVAPPAMHELIVVARNNADRLVRLINDMLDLDKMEAGRMDLDLTAIDAAELVDTAVSGVRSSADLAGVRLLRVTPAGVSVLGDRDRLLQVLTNLLSNAVRFSPPQAIVTVTVSESSEGRVRFVVEDEGPGVPRDRVNDLFRKFARISDESARRRGGTGLGLAISKAIVDQHGGVIGLVPGDRRGATFAFELPVTPALPSLDEPSVDDLFGDLRAAYTASLPAQVDALAALVARSRTDAVAHAEAVAIAHRLKGTAGTYGRHAVSEAAARVEAALRDPRGPGADAEIAAALEAAVGAMRAAVASC
jgi:signal transduction histidine kinase